MHFYVCRIMSFGFFVCSCTVVVYLFLSEIYVFYAFAYFVINGFMLYIVFSLIGSTNSVPVCCSPSLLVMFFAI